MNEQLDLLTVLENLEFDEDRHEEYREMQEKMEDDMLEQEWEQELDRMWEER